VLSNNDKTEIPMSGSIVAPLADRALVRVAGAEAEKFLEGLVTCEVEGMTPGTGAYGALLAPQGKILFDFFVVRTPDGFLIDVARALRDEFVRKLVFYRLRAKVEIAAADGLSVFAVWGDAPQAPADGFLIADPRLAELGWRVYSATPPAGGRGDYEARRIGLGVPEGGRDYVHGDCFPHEALLDQFGGVDFAKGCYVGQEVVSRMQHRGTARNRIVMVEARDELPPFSTELLAGGKPAGTMGSSAGGKGLARLRLDRVRRALDDGQMVTAGAQAVSVGLQPWARLSWPAE